MKKLLLLVFRGLLGLDLLLQNSLLMTGFMFTAYITLRQAMLKQY